MKMIKQLLNGNWHITTSGKYSYDLQGTVPGSLYTALMESKLIEDPFCGENEYKYIDISECDTVYERTFDLSPEQLDSEMLLLRFHGIDTIASIFVNGVCVGTANNMHRTWTFDIKELVDEKDNKVSVYIYSPNEYIAQKQAQEPLWGVAQTLPGFTHIRKPPYMMGWDWGPTLSDMGIWRDVEIIAANTAMIGDVRIRQDFGSYEKEKTVTLDIATKLEFDSGAEEFLVTVEYPDGEKQEIRQSAESFAHTYAVIEKPELWYPNGYGAQPLYKVTVSVLDKDGNIVDEKSHRVGIRKITICQDTVDDGRFFGFVVNGIRIFAMGANYVPEDHFITRTSLKKTKRLLQLCKRANYNMLRVWGGGVYASDEFYDLCDEMGFLVWQDFMFACGVYKGDEKTLANVRAEVIQNVRRLRNHPCIALWCGNNEIESMWLYWHIDQPQSYKKDYIRLFEVLIPRLLEKLDPDRFYHPSSPSSGGRFGEPGDITRGDQHYWEVWHSKKPFSDYLKYRFRFCSEYGFESLPSLKTVMTFAEKKDLNLMSPVMEAHQKCEDGNEKLMYYLAQMVHYPYSFEGLIYATQLVQSDAIRLNVEHMRRCRNVCSGSLYWQVNDSNPVISWSSVDYFLRLKPLHCAARRFYSPVLLTMYDKDGNIAVNVSSERRYEISARIVWNSRNADGSIIRSGEVSADIAPLHAEDQIILTDEMTGVTDKRSQYVECSLINTQTGKSLSSATYMYVLPKTFSFADPKLSVKVTDEGEVFRITISAKAFAKGVWIEGKAKNFDPVFSDNFIDIHDSADIFLAKTQAPGMTAAQVQRGISVTSYYSAMGLKG